MVAHTVTFEEWHWETLMPELSIPLKPKVHQQLLVRQEAPPYTKAPKSKNVDEKLHSSL